MSRRVSAVWFKRTRGSYLPCTPQGWLTYIPFLAWLIAAAAFGRFLTNSPVWLTVIVLPFWLLGWAGLTWLARRHSPKSRGAKRTLISRY